jgi:hypothetical protein
MYEVFRGSSSSRVGGKNNASKEDEDHLLVLVPVIDLAAAVWKPDRM